MFEVLGSGSSVEQAPAIKLNYSDFLVFVGNSPSGHQIGSDAHITIDGSLRVVIGKFGQAGRSSSPTERAGDGTSGSERTLPLQRADGPAEFGGGGARVGMALFGGGADDAAGDFLVEAFVVCGLEGFFYAAVFAGVEG